MARTVTICTEFVYPPIPRRRDCDWRATLVRYDIGDPIGWGPTEADAIFDLFEQIYEREADDEERYRCELSN